MNTDNVAVSVIIPVYNTSKYLIDAVNSATAQSLQNIEIIAINDGSTDNSLEILEQLAKNDKRIKVITQENKGLSATRNEGIHNATGDYIVFLDSDDMLQESALMECLDFCTYDAKAFIEEGVSESLTLDYNRKGALKEYMIYEGKTMFEELIKKMKYNPSSCLLVINKEFYLRNNLIFTPNILHEDQLFTTILYSKAKRVEYLPKLFYKRRFRRNSIMTSQFTWRNVSSYLYITDEINKLQTSVETNYAKVLDSYLTQMLNAVAYNAHALPLKQRIELFKIFTFNRYRHYVSNKNRFILLLKKILKPNIEKS